MTDRRTGMPLSRWATLIVASCVAVATWAVMVVVLGYAAMQHALALNAERLVEVAPGYLVAGLVAAAICGLTARITRRPLATRSLLVGLIAMNVLASIGAVAVFSEIPLERFPLVFLASTGGGLQLLGSVIGLRLGSTPRA